MRERGNHGKVEPVKEKLNYRDSGGADGPDVFIRGIIIRAKSEVACVDNFSMIL